MAAVDHTARVTQVSKKVDLLLLVFSLLPL